MIVFVGGIHGVGKTYLGEPVAKTLGVRHATASQLIREERGLQSWGSDKRVSDINDNQRALVSAMSRLKTSGKTLLLDGHFVLRQEDGQFQEIDVSVFRDLGIDAILLVDADVDVVLSRLHMRGDTSWCIEELSELARREAEHARRVASYLDAEFLSLTNPTHEKFSSSIQTFSRLLSAK